jgi:hypothetical protein
VFFYRPERSVIERDTLLIIEPANPEFIGNYLKGAGLQILTAQDGERGLEIALRDQPDQTVCG